MRVILNMDCTVKVGTWGNLSTVLFELDNFRGLKPPQIRITCLHWKLCIKLNTNLKQRLNAFHGSKYDAHTHNAFQYMAVWNTTFQQAQLFKSQLRVKIVFILSWLNDLFVKGAFLIFCENWSERVWETNNYVGLIVPLGENEVSSVQTIGGG